MSENKFQVPAHMQELVSTFTEMMTGEASQENVETVLQWALYMHVRSVMPPLVAHWGQANPEGAAQVQEAIKQVKALNEAWKAKRQAAAQTQPTE